MKITTVGLDLAKNVFQVHAINSASEVVVKKTLRRVRTSWPSLVISRAQ